MTPTATAAFVAAALAAVVDWGAVARRRKAVEYVAKPAVLAALVMAATALDPADSTVRAWFVAALVFSLAGDVFLMLPADRFVPGLASFLVAHLAYIGGFLAGGVESTAFAIGVAVVVPLTVLIGRRILRALRAGEDRALIAPVAAYMTAISVMVALSFGSPMAAAGALLFFASDGLIAWNRFVQPYPWASVTIIVTYHLGQALLVGSLV